MMELNQIPKKVDLAVELFDCKKIFIEIKSLIKNW